jgi:hypothetical protein
MAEVEVDLKTGKTKVLKMSYCGDHGTMGNQLSVDGQIYGSLSEGIGLALSEDFEDIKKYSTMTRAGFPFTKDVPDELELHYQQTRGSSVPSDHFLRRGDYDESTCGDHQRHLHLWGVYHEPACLPGESIGGPKRGCRQTPSPVSLNRDYIKPPTIGRKQKRWCVANAFSPSPSSLLEGQQDRMDQKGLRELEEMHSGGEPIWIISVCT